MTDYKELADRLDSEGHHWSGKPALLFFEAADAVRDLQRKYDALLTTGQMVGRQLTEALDREAGTR